MRSKGGLKGGARVSVPPVLDVKAGEIDQLVVKVTQGFSYQSLMQFIERAQLSKEDAIRLIKISPRTMHRRKETGKLSPEESDRLVRAARIIDHARQLFENDVKAANRWLSTPQPALAGATPLEYARTEVGAREVEALISRLEYGIFS
jgi:putative toxin-antitoxin system antitoxin component (TIGR02293 family)